MVSTVFLLAVLVSPLARAAQGTVSSFTATAKRRSPGDLVQRTNRLLFPTPVRKLFQRGRLCCRARGPAEAQASCSFPFVPTLGPLNSSIFWSRNILTASQKTF